MKVSDTGTKTVGELEEAALFEEDCVELQSIIELLVDKVRDLESEIEACSCDPLRNRVLAESILSFAEWQNSGYMGPTHTRQAIARSLWSEVSRNVAAITGRAPEDVGVDSPQLDLFAAG